MSRIKSKWTRPEKRIHNILKGNRIRHKMHPSLLGNPDVYLKDFNTIIYIDGCFWHNCPIHGHVPEKNREYWEKKIGRNVARDKKYTKMLTEEGYNVLRFWECDVMSEGFKSKLIETIRNI